MTNPNPSRISDAMWAFWLAFKALEPTVQLGGIYAAKPGYHNVRDALPRSDYSVQLDLDRQGPGDKAAAIDLTFPDAQAGDYATIAKYSARLLASGRDPDDERGSYLREFYGNADLDSEVEGWDFQRVGPATSDDSHLWHIHLSFMRAYLDDPAAFAAVLSILQGSDSRESDMLTAIRTTDKNGDAVFLLPWNHTWFRVTSSRANPWPLDNVLQGLAAAGVAVNDTMWPGPYDFSDPAVWEWAGVEVTRAGRGGAGPIRLELSGTGTPV